MNKFTESEVEDAALYYFDQLGYTILGGGDIAPGEPQAERTDYKEVILESRLRSALAQINPQIPTSALDEVVRQVLRSETQNLFENNRRFHRLLTDGVPVSYQKRLLRKYGYPPDKQEKATLTVLAQAEALCRDWAA